MPSLAIDYINTLAAEEGYTRGFDPDIPTDHFLPDDDDLGSADVALPDMMPIDGRADAVPLDGHSDPPDAGVIGVTPHSEDHNVTETSDDDLHGEEQHEAETAEIP